MQQSNNRLHPQWRTSNNPWPLIALVLAACSGGGGGGGGRTPQITTILPDGKRQVDMNEGEDVFPDIDFLTSTQRAQVATDLTVREVMVNSDELSGSITYYSQSLGQNFSADFKLAGLDAHLLKVVKNNGGLQLKFRYPPDFEAPQDYGRDNHYDFTITVTMPPDVPYRSFADDIPGWRIRVLDVQGNADQTPPIGLPAISSLGQNSRQVDLAEGETIVAANVQADVNAYTPRGGRYQRLDVADDGITANLIFSQANGTEARVTYTLSGTDAHLFKLADLGKAGTFGGIAFRNAPDYEAPKDSGGDNEYNFVLTVAGDLATFTRINIRVRVTDVTGDADPTPPSAGASQQIMDTTFDDLAMANDNLPPNDADII